MLAWKPKRNCQSCPEAEAFGTGSQILYRCKVTGRLRDIFDECTEKETTG